MYNLVIVSTEIGAQNISLMENLLDNYILYYITPQRYKCGGVGIYIRNKLQNATIVNELSIVLSCTCQRCEIESLFDECMFHGIKYVIAGGINRPQNGNVPYFNQELEITLNKIETKCRSVTLGDMNIDIIKLSDDKDTLQYVTTLTSHKYLQFITMHTRLTPYLATCKGHIFMKVPDPMLSPDIMCGILFCDISDHLPNFMSISHEYLNTSRENRTLTGIFTERNCANFIR